MRAFIAIEVPDEIRARLADLQRELAPTTRAARWVAANSIHLTLKFLGEIRQERIEAIDAGLSLSWNHFPISVRGVGFFPGARSPRVLWAGLHAPTLEALTEQIDTQLDRAGFEREKRKFRPHITLARSKDTRLERELVAAATKFSETDFGSFTVDRLFLFESTLNPGGSIYKKVREYLL